MFIYDYTQARLLMPSDLFLSKIAEVQNYSLIVYQDIEGSNMTELSNNWKVLTWAESNLCDIILPYQTTPGQWMPFDS